MRKLGISLAMLCNCQKTQLKTVVLCKFINIKNIKTVNILFKFHQHSCISRFDKVASSKPPTEWVYGAMQFCQLFLLATVLLILFTILGIVRVLFIVIAWGLFTIQKGDNKIPFFSTRLTLT